MRHLILALLVIVMSLLPVLADDARAPVIPEEAVQAALEDMPGLHEIVTVEVIVADFGDGPVDMLTVIYLTQEMSELGYRLETLDLFRAMAQVIKLESIDVDMLVVVPSVTEDSAIEIASADLDDVLTFLEGDITRSDFIAGMTITPGAHQSQPDDEGSEV